VLEQSEKIRALEKQIDEVHTQLGAEILRAGQAEAELRRVAAETRNTTEAQATVTVQHAPGTAILCPDCRAKGHSVCMGVETPQTAVERTGES
jgi:hypothetical protein